MAGVPILPVGFDFKTKQVVLGELLYPGTDEEADFKRSLLSIPALPENTRRKISGTCRIRPIRSYRPYRSVCMHSLTYVRPPRVVGGNNVRQQPFSRHLAAGVIQPYKRIPRFCRLMISSLRQKHFILKRPNWYTAKPSAHCSFHPGWSGCGSFRFVRNDNSGC